MLAAAKRLTTSKITSCYVYIGLIDKKEASFGVSFFKFFANFDNMILAKIFVWLLVVGTIAFQDLVKHKEPFDKGRKVFSFKTDYWQFRWDNLALSFIISALGAIIASEVGGYALVQLLKTYAPDQSIEIIDGTFELTAVAVCSYFIPKKILSKQG